MILFRFRMKTGENIGSQSAIGDDTFDGCHPVQIPLTGILTVHQFQNTRTAALHRQMDMFTHIRNLRNYFQRFITHILRMGSRETNTHSRSSLGHCSEQHRESNHFACRSFKTVRVDVLPQQGDFLIAFRHEVCHFIQDAFYVTAALASTSIGHDTIGAEVIAATHDGYKTRNMIAADTRRNHIPISLGSRKFHIDCFFTGFYGRNQVGQRQVSIRPHNEVYMMIRYQIILYPFGHTAQYTYNQMLFLFLQRVEKLQAIQNLLLRIVADGTGIHKHGIGFLQRFGYGITRHLHHRGNHLTVGYIHLAAIGFDKQLFVVILHFSCGFKVRSR